MLKLGKAKLNVKLLRYTPEPEKIIAMSARLCYSPLPVEDIVHEFESNKKKYIELVEKLLKIGHLTPFEHVSFTFAIEGVSRSLLAQITRHRIASFSVQSQRYVGETSDQNEDSCFDYIIPPSIEELGEEAVNEFCEQMKVIQKWYDKWVERLGGERSSYEDARFVLPNAAVTKMFVTMNARELMHFFSLRCCNRAQWEIRAVADKMLTLVKEKAPVVFKKSGPKCLTGDCPEGHLSCGRLQEVRDKYSRMGV